jgi:hypothetical protein
MSPLLIVAVCCLEVLVEERCLCFRSISISVLTPRASSLYINDVWLPIQLVLWVNVNQTPVHLCCVTKPTPLVWDQANHCKPSLKACAFQVTALALEKFGGQDALEEAREVRLQKRQKRSEARKDTAATPSAGGIVEGTPSNAGALEIRTSELRSVSTAVDTSCL